MDFDFDTPDYGPFSLKGVLFYFVGAYQLWASDKVQRLSSVLGTIVFVWFVWNFISSLLRFIRPSNVQIYCHSETGSWVLVTGASDGIGYGFAEVFLDRGFNVLLHGRNAQKLAGIQKELAGKYPRRTIDYVVADASSPDDACPKVVEKVRSLPGKLTILVNNVGGSITSPIYLGLWEVPAKDVDAIIDVNARFPTQLTRALLPVLKDNGPALVMNCGSMAGEVGSAYITTYAATKGYIHSFTRALRAELQAEGGPWNQVEVMGFLIANVRSARNDAEMSFMTISSHACAAGCVAKVGNGNTLNYASWRHAVAAEIVMRLPSALSGAMMAKEMKKRRQVEQKQQ